MRAAFDFETKTNVQRRAVVDFDIICKKTTTKCPKEGSIWLWDHFFKANVQKRATFDFGTIFQNKCPKEGSRWWNRDVEAVERLRPLAKDLRGLFLLFASRTRPSEQKRRPPIQKPTQKPKLKPTTNKDLKGSEQPLLTLRQSDENLRAETSSNSKTNSKPKTKTQNKPKLKRVCASSSNSSPVGRDPPSRRFQTRDVLQIKNQTHFQKRNTLRTIWLEIAAKIRLTCFLPFLWNNLEKLNLSRFLNAKYSILGKWSLKLTDWSSKLLYHVHIVLPIWTGLWLPPTSYSYFIFHLQKNLMIILYYLWICLWSCHVFILFTR